jgi:predicted transcriptional regulator
MTRKAPKPLDQLGELQREVLESIWELDGGTVQEVVDHLQPNRKPAYTTVLTTLQNLTRAGWLKPEKTGRAYTWHATKSRDQASGKSIAAFVRRAFGCFENYIAYCDTLVEPPPVVVEPPPVEDVPPGDVPPADPLAGAPMDPLAGGQLIDPSDPAMAGLGMPNTPIPGTTTHLSFWQRRNHRESPYRSMRPHPRRLLPVHAPAGMFP